MKDFIQFSESEWGPKRCSTKAMADSEEAEKAAANSSK